MPGKEALSIIGCEKHRAWAAQAADEAVTLVKDTQNLLPLSPRKYKRLYLNVIQRDLNPSNPTVEAWKRLFENEGFEVTVRNRAVSATREGILGGRDLCDEQRAFLKEINRTIHEVRETYDLYVYICNVETESSRTTLRLNWRFLPTGLGDDVPWFVSEIPTLMISTAYPYHLFDAPMIKTYINAYAGTDDFKKAVIEKLMGRSPFKGISPIDPFCGREDTKQ